jgi:hypothetical protein
MALDAERAAKPYGGFASFSRRCLQCQPLTTFTIFGQDLAVSTLLAPNGKKDTDQNGVSAEVTASALTLLTALAKPARLGKTNLHPYRLEVKELRNVLQMAENSDRQESVRQLGEVRLRV